MRLASILLSVTLVPFVNAQTDWPVYGHDPGGMRYSPLKQVTVANVGKLRRAWTYHTGETGRQFETTPIVVGGTMYLSTQMGRVVALAPETGKEIWSYDPKVGRSKEHRGAAGTPAELRIVVDYLARNMAGPAGSRRGRAPLKLEPPR